MAGLAFLVHYVIILICNKQDIYICIYILCYCLIYNIYIYILWYVLLNIPQRVQVPNVLGLW